MTGSTYKVAEKISNAEGNEVDNPDFDPDKIGTKEVQIVVPLTSMEKRVVTVANRDHSPTNATFKITDTKFLEQLKTEF